jgi:hypothetical protein
MSEPVHVAVICEGATERIFVQTVLSPHFSMIGIYLNPTLITKKGQKGGDVKFDRLCKDLENHLSHGHNHCVTTFFDFYGLKGNWPGYEEAKMQIAPAEKLSVLLRAVKEAVVWKLDSLRADKRFLPYFSMHEIEALYFSCPASIAQHLGIKPDDVRKILEECEEPEAINHDELTSPSHRLNNLTLLGEFKKTTTGIAIAQTIGLQKMRAECPLFHSWIESIESLAAQEK